jgi:hypothetical protein
LSELKKPSQNRLGDGNIAPGRSTSESPPEATGGNNKDPSPSTITAESRSSPSEEREAAGGGRPASIDVNSGCTLEMAPAVAGALSTEPGADLGTSRTTSTDEEARGVANAGRCCSGRQGHPSSGWDRDSIPSSNRPGAGICPLGACDGG